MAVGCEGNNPAATGLLLLTAVLLAAVCGISGYHLLRRQVCDAASTLSRRPAVGPISSSCAVDLQRQPPQQYVYIQVQFWLHLVGSIGSFSSGILTCLTYRRPRHSCPRVRGRRPGGGQRLVVGALLVSMGWQRQQQL